jgi:MFS superfamily sulfate permease-like transporter
MAALMGLPPVLGVLTSIISTPIVVLFGRNSLLIGGTASATVPFIASAVRAQGIAGAAKISIVASVFMMCFCILRLSRQVSRVPIAVVAGFSAGIGALMGISLLDIGTWHRLRKMRLLDAAAFLITVIGVLISNAVTALLAGAEIYMLHYWYTKYLRPLGLQSGAADRVA